MPPFHTHSPHSNVTIWPDSNNALTVSSKLKGSPSSWVKHIFTKTMQTLCSQTLILSTALLYTSQSHPFLNFKPGDNNHIETYQYLCYIMLGSPQSELGTAIKLTISAVQSVKNVVPFWRCLLPATSGRTVTVLPVELQAVGSFDTLVNVYS